MSLKYRGLPDIDTAPDVFETADEPEIPLRPSNEDLGGNDTPKKHRADGIDDRGLPDRRRTEKAFGRVRRQDGTFQLGLPPLSRTLSSSSDELLAKPRETPASRIRRLKAELAEVEKEIAAGPSAAVAGSERDDEQAKGNILGLGDSKRRSVLPPRMPMDVVGEVTKLQARLAKLDARSASGPAQNDAVAESRGKRDKLEQLGQTEPSTMDGEEGVQKDNDASAPSLTEMDLRMAKLERILGDSSSGMDQLPTPALTITLQKHEHLLNILTQPRHLDAITRRIKLLLVDLDRAAAASRRAGVSVTSGHTPLNGQTGPAETVTLSSSEYAQLTDLFNLLPRLDALLPIIPPLLARLSSLSALHAEAADMAVRLGKADAGDTEDKEAEADMRFMLAGVQQGLRDGTATIQDNWKAVDSRLEQLKQRLAKLE